MWKPNLPPFREFKKNVFTKAARVSNFIYQIGETPILRQPSKEVDLKKIISTQQRAKFQYLKNCLLNYRKLTGYGRGVTAVQVGIPERFSVIYTEKELMIIVNPTITKKSKKLLEYPELCMSACPVIAPTIRPAWIEFEYFDEEGHKKYWNTKDSTKVGRIMNRVFQHEIDHMEGIINVDIVKNPQELILESDPQFYTHASFKEIKSVRRK